MTMKRERDTPGYAKRTREDVDKEKNRNKNRVDRFIVGRLSQYVWPTSDQEIV